METGQQKQEKLQSFLGGMFSSGMQAAIAMQNGFKKEEGKKSSDAKSDVGNKKKRERW